jgi:hypothetical protein
MTVSSKVLTASTMSSFQMSPLLWWYSRRRAVGRWEFCKSESREQVLKHRWLLPSQFWVEEQADGEVLTELRTAKECTYLLFSPGRSRCLRKERKHQAGQVLLEWLISVDTWVSQVIWRNVDLKFDWCIGLLSTPGSEAFKLCEGMECGVEVCLCPNCWFLMSDY